MSSEPSVENLVNFSIGDFFKRGWDTIAAKTDLFSRYFHGLLRTGLVMRLATGAAGHRMSFADPATGDSSELLMFGSNNYLGLANEPFVVERVIEAMREYGVGIGGPPLFNGYTRLHQRLEQRLAEIKCCDAALLFSSGYAANLGWVTGLLGSGDVLIYDVQNHASLYDGMKMGRFEAVPFAHNDVDDLRARLMQVRYEQPYTNVAVCVEGVYSMDGDIVRLPEVRRLCTKYDALLVVDDAHGTGVLGEKGWGTPEHFGLEGQIDLIMGTFSKTFAVTGGFVAGPKALIDYLRFFSRSYMFSASLPPTVVATALAGIDFLEAHPERVRQLRDNVRYMVEGLQAAGFRIHCESAVIPIFLPPGLSVSDTVLRLHREGLFVNGVEYPAVPRSRQRLRLSVMATFTRADLDYAIDKLTQVGRELGFVGWQGREGAA